MSFFKTKQGMALIAAIVVVIVIIIAVFAFSCDDETDKAAGTTSATTATSTRKETAAVEIISQSVEPSSATEGDTLTFTALVKGDPASVSLTDQLPPATGDGQPGENFTMEMTMESRDGDVTTWTLQATASGVGRHPFFATAIDAEGNAVQATGVAPTYMVSSATPATPAPVAPAAELEIVSSTVNPATVNNGGTLNFTVKAKGEPDAVRMNYGPAGGSIGNNNTLELARTGSEAGGISVWQGSMTADISKCFGPDSWCYYTAEAMLFNGPNGQLLTVKVANNGEWKYNVTP
ncbi:MAG: hypothetical protein ACYC5A_04745 [Thermoleophilia bacterium]